MLSGRQGLHLIYAYFVTDQQASAVHNLEDLRTVTFYGDQKLETFLNNWDSVLVGMGSIPGMVKESRVLSLDLENLER